MARDFLVSLAASGSSIHSSSSPTTTSVYSVENIIAGDLVETWQYSQAGALLDFPINAIIDFGEDKNISELELYGRSFLWEGGSCPKAFRVSVSPDLGRNPQDGDFEIVWAGSLPKPTQTTLPTRTVYSAIAGASSSRILQLVWANDARTSVEPRFARYAKISIESIWDLDVGTIGLSELRVYGQIEVSTTITSDAEIDPSFAPPIFSDAQITVNLILGTDTNVPSSALLVWSSGPTGPTVAEAAALAAGEVTYMRAVRSDTQILAPGTRIVSDGSIAGPETTTILSDASIRRTAQFVMAAHIAYPASGSFSTLEGEGYSPDLFEKRKIMISNLDTTSVGTVVSDLFTSEVIDLNTVSPPFGFKNYDWSYDWAARTFNGAIYLIETREGNTLNELTLALFSAKNLGHRFVREHVPRFHQYRIHAWASGSGDFEFHQFTIRGHVVQGSADLAHSLIQKPFLTTNVINFDIARTWEPDLSKALLWTKSYTPGDVTGDGGVTGADWYALFNSVFRGTALTEPRAGDVNASGDTTSADLLYLLNYISGSGPPPRVIPD